MAVPGEAVVATCARGESVRRAEAGQKEDSGRTEVEVRKRDYRESTEAKAQGEQLESRGTAEGEQCVENTALKHTETSFAWH